MEIDNINKILVIEDNLGDFILIEEYLCNYFDPTNIVNASTYSQSKIYLTDPNQNFTIVFLDLGLPDKNGEELIKSVLELAKEIPVVVLTGFGDISFGIKSLSLGISDYLNKDDLNPTILYKSILYNIERKKKRLAIEESKNRYSNLFHLSPIPMWVFDIETLYFLDVNDAAIANYGYSMQEFLAMTIDKIRPEKELEKMKMALENWNQNGIQLTKAIFIHQKKNGIQIEAEIQSSYIEFKGRKAKLILSNDVTERNKYLKAIEKQNEKLKEIAWIQTNKVCNPVGHIVSILKQIEDQNLDKENKNILFENLNTTTLELDVIIKEITSKTRAINTDEVD